jgi:hypothetical protein
MYALEFVWIQAYLIYFRVFRCSFTLRPIVVDVRSDSTVVLPARMLEFYVRILIKALVFVCVYAILCVRSG